MVANIENQADKMKKLWRHLWQSLEHGCEVMAKEQMRREQIFKFLEINIFLGEIYQEFSHKLLPK